MSTKQGISNLHISLKAFHNMQYTVHTQHHFNQLSTLFHAVIVNYHLHMSPTFYCVIEMGNIRSNGFNP